MSEISPKETQVVDAISHIRQENPATEALGCAKLLALVKLRNPTWALSEKRLKSILKQHGLQASTQQQTFGSKVDSDTMEGLELPPGLSVHHTRGRGKALYAGVDITRGDELWTEDVMVPVAPLDKVQLVRKSLACALCARTFQMRDKEGSPQGGADCNHCEARWCSVKCHNADVIHAALWHHNPRSKIDEDAWVGFEQYCFEHDWQAMYATGVILISMIKDPSKQHDLRKRVESMASIRQDEADKFNDDEEGEYQEPYELLVNAFKPSLDLEYEEFMRVLGLYNLNNYKGQLYAIASHVNHSCDPNMMIENCDHKSNDIKVTALKDVQAGDELLFTYVDSTAHEDLSHRRHFLKTKYGFWCNCSSCKEEEKQLNDAAQATLDSGKDVLAMYVDIQAKLRPRRKSVRFDDQIKLVA